MDKELESQSLQLLLDLQAVLVQVLKSLSGKPPKKTSDTYLYHTAQHINQALASYIFLRQNGMTYGSTLLIRTTLEATFLLEAVRRKPDLLYRVAYGEHEQDLKFLKACANQGGEDLTAVSDTEWLKVKAWFITNSPEAVIDEILNIKDTATAADLITDYEIMYRYYCRSTHAALRSSIGQLQALSHLDNATMAAAALRTLETVSALGGDSPDTVPLRARTLEIRHRAANTKVISVSK